MEAFERATADRAARVQRRPLDGGDVDRLRALVALLLLVGHLRALGERAVPVGVDAGVMDEEVAAALVRGDEAEALLVAEPLHGSGRHCPALHCWCAACAEDAVSNGPAYVALLSAGISPGLPRQNVPGTTRPRH